MAAAPRSLARWLALGLVVGAAGLQAPMTPRHRPDASLALDVDLANSFGKWRRQEVAHDLLRTQINSMACPDVNVRVVFEGIAKPTVLPGSARCTTAALSGAATRLHKLDTHQKLRFNVGGYTLPMNLPVSESPLANTQDLEVLVMGTSGFPARRADGSSWWSGAAAPSGHRGSASARNNAATRRMAARSQANSVLGLKADFAAKLSTLDRDFGDD